MHKILSLTLMLLVLLPAAKGYALSDSEYRVLMEAPQFRKAEEELARAWNGLCDDMSKEDKRFVLERQRKWIRTGRDADAHELQSLGISKVNAYTIATFKQIGLLNVYSFNYLNEIGKESPRGDDYYSYEMIKQALKIIEETGEDVHFLAKKLEIELDELDN